MTPPSASSPEPASPAPDYGTLWSSALRLHPIYAELAREFVIDAPPCAGLDESVDAPDRETVEHAQQWLQEMDDRIQVHQLRQFLQTSSLVDGDGLIALVQHFLGKKAHTDAARDKIDFLLVQYFSQGAPSELDDNGADIAYVAQGLEPVLGKVELKAPVWLNALDRVLDRHGAAVRWTNCCMVVCSSRGAKPRRRLAIYFICRWRSWHLPALDI